MLSPITVYYWCLLLFDAHCLEQHDYAAAFKAPLANC